MTIQVHLENQYLPHPPVNREDHSSNSVSVSAKRINLGLSDSICKGSCLTPIFEVLDWVRLYHVVNIADIEKAYIQIFAVKNHCHS